MSVNSNGQPCRPEASVPSFNHLCRLTDDTGLLEHALGRIPRRREGYTTDDNARALWTTTEWLSFKGAAAISLEAHRELTRLTDIYLAFMLWAQNEDGWWLNNFAYDRTLEPEDISHDCQGRSIWACADAWIRLEGPRRETARIIVERALPTLNRIDSLRGQAFAMATCVHLLEASRDGKIVLGEPIRKELSHHVNRLELLLNGAFQHFSDHQWHWFEPAMTYSNGVLPWAMLRTYRFTERPETLTTGLESLSYLLEVMSSEEGWLCPIGNEGWCTYESVSRWDQQPLEMFKLALALDEAAFALETLAHKNSASLVGSAKGASISGARALENDVAKHVKLSRSSMNIGSYSYFLAKRNLCRDWYYGANELQVPVIDATDGSCCDGLTKYGPNINCGAEATLSYLMTEALCRRGV
jgi:hypothetical protein